MSSIPIARDTVVTIHYRLTLDDGSIADQSFGGEPLAYLHGHGNLVPGLERQLLGKAPGDAFDAVVPPDEGYGDYDPDGDATIPRKAFPADVQPGMAFHSEQPDGEIVPLFVRELRGDDVLVTTNHPLAGQRLNFRIEIQNVRKATREELEHGHVHGLGGHHHHH